MNILIKIRLFITLTCIIYQSNGLHYFNPITSGYNLYPYISQNEETIYSNPQETQIQPQNINVQKNKYDNIFSKFEINFPDNKPFSSETKAKTTLQKSVAYANNHKLFYSSDSKAIDLPSKPKKFTTYAYNHKKKFGDKIIPTHDVVPAETTYYANFNHDSELDLTPSEYAFHENFLPNEQEHEEVHYHQHKHVHEHAHQQQHAHSHSQQHAHAHSGSHQHAHEHQSWHQHQNNANHQHEHKHAQQHVHNQLGEHKHQHGHAHNHVEDHQHGHAHNQHHEHGHEHQHGHSHNHQSDSKHSHHHEQWHDHFGEHNHEHYQDHKHGHKHSHHGLHKHKHAHDARHIHTHGSKHSHKHGHKYKKH